MLGDEDTITWYGMDNQGLLCTKADLMAIGGLITELHSYCWNLNAYIKEQGFNAGETKVIKAENPDNTYEIQSREASDDRSEGAGRKQLFEISRDFLKTVKENYL